MELLDNIDGCEKFPTGKKILRNILDFSTSRSEDVITLLTSFFFYFKKKEDTKKFADVKSLNIRSRFHPLSEI